MELFGPPQFGLYQRLVNERDAEATVLLLGKLDYEKSTIHQLTVFANVSFRRGRALSIEVVSHFLPGPLHRDRERHEEHSGMVLVRGGARRAGYSARLHESSAHYRFKTNPETRGRSAYRASRRWRSSQSEDRKVRSCYGGQSLRELFRYRRGHR